MQTIHNNILKDTMYYNDIPVLSYEINYPSFTTGCSNLAARKINTYYAARAEAAEQNCRTSLFPQALETAQYIQNNTPPFNSYEVLVTYHTSYNHEHITSLYTEEYTYLGGAHGSTVRTSETWNFCTGRQIRLSDYFPGQPAFPENLFPCIEEQVKAELKESPSAFFDDYPALLRKHFREENFYLTPEGVIIYYQQYDIAPYASGLPEFLLPFQR